MKRVFVTGATGALGSALVPLFLAEPETQVVLLLRANSQEDLQGRVQGLWRFWGLSADDPDVSPRLRALRGDVSLPAFGLPEPEYARLCAETTHIIHSAATVKMTLPLAAARASAVTSARHILELAAACQQRGNLAKVDIVSTVGVAGRTAGLIPEQPLPDVRQFHNTYEAAKAEAESVVLARHDIPLTIHRPSMVVGDSRTGKIIHFQVFYHLYESLLTGQYTDGFVPDVTHAVLDLVPVDYVARAIHWASGQAATVGRILHLCSGPEKALPLLDIMHKVSTFMQTARAHVVPLQPVSLEVLRHMLPRFAASPDPHRRRAVATLPLFLDYLDAPQAFDTMATTATLIPAGIVVPTVDTYLKTILTYYEHRKTLRQVLPS